MRKTTKRAWLERLALVCLPVLALSTWLFARGARREGALAGPVALGVMEPVDWLIAGPIVVTMDPDRRVIHDGAVAIRGDTIVAVGKAATLEAKYKPEHPLELRDGILIPGLINGHTHAAMTLFRGLGDDQNLQDWLHKYIFPAEARNVTPAFVREGTRLALVEMIRSGTTTFADMYYFENDVAEVTEEAGERGVLGETVIGFPAPDNKTPADAFAYIRKFVARWKGNALITPAVAPHAIYTVPGPDLKESGELSRQLGVPLLIHLAETKTELDNSLSEHHLTPVGYLNSLHVLAPNMTAAHCVWVDAADMRLLARHDVGCVYCPSSNLKLADGMAPVTKLIAAGVPVGLGTDGAASNNNLDLMREIDFAAKLQKLATMNPTAMPAEEALALATIDGARALHMQNEIGSIEVRKKADLTFLSLDSAHAVPLYNVYSQIVYALESSDVKDVFVGGKPLMLNGKLLTLDEAAIIAKAREYGKQVLQSLEPATAPKS
jgi:5-methylthioadenosine/S-adenosylhomocysteine deaminase